jgi:DNA-binding transcriptional MerR regulator
MTNPLSDIRHYSPTMTISQVMKFCEKKGIGITRAMVQNYVRDKLLPPPVNKRLYTHEHLATLVLIDRLKTVFDIPLIRDALAPFKGENGIPVEVYERLWEQTETLSRGLIASNATVLNNEKDGGTLLTMACAAAVKEIATEDIGGESHG